MTLNVRGLGDGTSSKTHLIRRFLARKRADVAVLTEVQGRDSAKLSDAFSSYKSFWNLGAHAGVGLLFLKNGSAANPVAVPPRESTAHDDQLAALSGRALRANFAWNGLPLSLIGVYAPASASVGDTQRFAAGIRRFLLPAKLGARQLLLAGDFNTTTGLPDERLSKSYKKDLQRHEAWVHHVLGPAGLEDVHLKIFPARPAAFTWFGPPWLALLLLRALTVCMPARPCSPRRTPWCATWHPGSPASTTWLWSSPSRRGTLSAPVRGAGRTL